MPRQLEFAATCFDGLDDLSRDLFVNVCLVFHGCFLPVWDWGVVVVDQHPRAPGGEGGVASTRSPSGAFWGQTVGGTKIRRMGGLVGCEGEALKCTRFQKAGPSSVIF